MMKLNTAFSLGFQRYDLGESTGSQIIVSGLAVLTSLGNLLKRQILWLLPRITEQEL